MLLSLLDMLGELQGDDMAACRWHGACAAPALPCTEPRVLRDHPCRMVHATDIVELELNSKKFKLSVKKREALEAAEPTVIHVPAPAAAYAPAPAAPAPAPAPAAPAPAPAAASAPAAPAKAPAAPAAPAAVDGLEVVSPMAGTMYRSPAPGEPVFVKVCGLVRRRL